jgi:hypothetical protein
MDLRSQEEIYPGPLYRFEDLNCCTMTVIVTYDVSTLNLPGIFSIMNVTKEKIPKGMELQKKQNKIVLPPELNIPGEIISMRFNGQTRGIVRSLSKKKFLHAIIIDIGWPGKIVSFKLSRGIIEFTGVTNYETAKNVANLVLSYINSDQEKIMYLRKNILLAKDIAEYILLLNEFPTYDSLQYYLRNKQEIKNRIEEIGINKLLEEMKNDEFAINESYLKHTSDEYLESEECSNKLGLKYMTTKQKNKAKNEYLNKVREIL